MRVALLLLVPCTCLGFIVAAAAFPRAFKCDLYVLQFSDRYGHPTRLNVDLKLVNIPPNKGVNYKAYMYCLLGTRQDVNGRWSESNRFSFDIVLNDHLDDCYIAFCMRNERDQSCLRDRDPIYDVIHLKHSADATSSPIYELRLTLDLNDCNIRDTQSLSDGVLQDSRLPAEKLTKSNDWNSDKDTPTLHIDPNSEFNNRINIRCSVLGQKFDLLSLHQKRKGVIKRVLNMTQSNGTSSTIILTHVMTLTVSDKESIIFCVKQKPDDLSYEKKGNSELLTDGAYSFDAPAPKVILEPATNITLFSRDAPVSLVCSGTVRGSNLTWYIQDTSKIEVVDPSSQQYDKKTNKNKLTLWWNDDYVTKTLFCAQDSRMLIQYSDGVYRMERFGVEASSNYTKLRLREEIKDDVQTDGLERLTPESSVPHLWLVNGVVVGVVLLITVVVVILRLRRTESGAGHGESQNATPGELTYAVLDLPKSNAPVKENNMSPYVQIVGVYNPRK